MQQRPDHLLDLPYRDSEDPIVHFVSTGYVPLRLTI